jgi:hypothetical protein
MAAIARSSGGLTFSVIISVFIVALVAGGGEASAAAPAPLRLSPRRDGGYLHEGERFVARISPDGTVQFSEKPASSSIHILPPLPRNRYVGQPEMSRLQRELKGVLSRRSSTKLLTPPPMIPPISPYRHTPNAETCFLPDGTIVCECIKKLSDAGPAGECAAVPLVTFHTSFDLNDEYARAMGRDPLAREKAAFLAATFELRLGMANRARRKSLERSAGTLQEQLDGLWRDSRYRAIERRRMLFELWKDADSGAPSPSEGQLAVVNFIKTRLPPGSPDSYTPQEILDIRSSRSGGKFDPYQWFERPAKPPPGTDGTPFMTPAPSPCWQYHWPGRLHRHPPQQQLPERSLLALIAAK